MKANDPLAVLEVIDRLDIGPVQIEPEALRVPYRIFKGARQDVYELCVSYEEPVFDPARPSDLNLATMIGVQDALSYGLFCRRIRFVGPFDNQDRKFLRVMLAKLAREIYVSKLLDPGAPVGEAWKGLPTLLRSDYVRAEVTFSNGEGTGDARAGQEDVPPLPDRWVSNRQRYAVLSKGETQGLLSFGLLNELGYECRVLDVEPDLVENRSPRARRSQASQVDQEIGAPLDAVRSNSKGLHELLAHHLCFLRPDALKLWTQTPAVFAVLPILRRERIGSIATHGLFDDTLRTWHHRIPYHGGRYELSRQGDRALARYFRSKGWGIRPFSLLRSLSELLAEKILWERYPSLPQGPAACEKPRCDRGKMRPCAKCEPCRRTISMMAALGADPRARGFKAGSLLALLQRVAREGIDQDRAGVEHLAFLLSGQGLIPRPQIGRINAKPRHEIMDLRFDDSGPMLEEVPACLRQPLLEILLEHAGGMLRRTGNRWEEIYDYNEPLLEEREAGRYFERYRSA